MRALQRSVKLIGLNRRPCIGGANPWDGGHGVASASAVFSGRSSRTSAAFTGHGWVDPCSIGTSPAGTNWAPEISGLSATADPLCIKAGGRGESAAARLRRVSVDRNCRNSQAIVPTGAGGFPRIFVYENGVSSGRTNVPPGAWWGIKASVGCMGQAGSVIVR